MSGIFLASVLLTLAAIATPLAFRLMGRSS
jgi:hypothetical protein